MSRHYSEKELKESLSKLIEPEKLEHLRRDAATMKTSDLVLTVEGLASNLLRAREIVTDLLAFIDDAQYLNEAIEDERRSFQESRRIDE